MLQELKQRIGQSMLSLVEGSAKRSKKPSVWLSLVVGDTGLLGRQI